MLTLYHAPMSRSTRLVQLVHELGAQDRVRIEIVDVKRGSGEGERDPRNPHPEGKVPFLVHDGVEIWESVAIAQYLADLFPEAGLAVPQGDPRRGRYLSWLAWYAAVVEPVIVLQFLGVDTPVSRYTFRSFDEVVARLEQALTAAPYLCGESYTTADLIHAGTFGWQPKLTPDVPAIRDWVQRCQSRPSVAAAWGGDAKLMGSAA